MIWRPILAKIVTKKEMDEYWTINDLYDAHEALDIEQEAENYFAKKG